MADINNLTTQSQNSVDIESSGMLEDILREYGLDDVIQTSTVVQQNDNIINIPSMLEPPSIQVESVHNLEPLTAQLLQDGNAPIDISSEETPSTEENVGRDLDAEEDMDWNALEQSGAIREVTTDSTQDITTLSAQELIDLLPVNSKSFEVDESMSRFSGAAWFEAIQNTTVTLAGLGGIGSYVLFCLSRMKPKQIFIYDDDIVETVNLSGQLYSSAMVGKKKVDAMAQLAQDFSSYYGTLAVPTKFTRDTAATDIMICGFDNMQARGAFFEAWLQHIANHPNREKCLFIDGRLNMEEFQVFCMRGDDTFNIKRYHDEYMFLDHTVKEAVCSMKQTTYCSNMIGSIIVNLFTNFVANVLTKTKPLIDRDLPFKTYYNASMMYFKTEL